MSRLWIVRHADAESGSDDAKRELSPRGRWQAEALGRLVNRLNLRPPGAVWHSPLVRAHQTAELLKSSAGWDCPVEAWHGLLPEDDPREVGVRLPAEGDAVIIGHNPHLTGLASWLVTGNAHADAFHVRKASCICLERSHAFGRTPEEGGGWVVAWMLTPEVVPE
jgi:phosphohistidine phosphatase